MIAAAVQLFARSGYHGTTTKEVSELAHVSESNIFRYYPTKRDLFLSAIRYELSKVARSADILVRAVNANDAHTALLSVFEVITKTAAQQPELVRLLHFSSMEFGPDMEPLFRLHVRPYIECLSNVIRRWSRSGQISEVDPMLTVLSFIATVMLMQDVLPAFAGSTSPFATVEDPASAYADLWCRVLAVLPASPLSRQSALPGDSR